MKGDDVTLLLQAAEAGDATSLDRILPLLYDELRELARRHGRRERPGHTLAATELVHEAYLRLVRQDRATWRNRGQFLGVASLAMRRLLVSHARRRARLRHGGGAWRVTLVTGLEAELPAAEPGLDPQAVLKLDALLERLAAFDARAARVVECRWFAGLTVEETAVALAVSAPTVKRDWAVARAWLRRELEAAK